MIIFIPVSGKKNHNIQLFHYPLSYRTSNLYFLQATSIDLFVTCVVPNSQILALPFCYYCKKLIITLCGVVSDGVIFTPSVVKIGHLVGRLESHGNVLV